MAWIPDRYHRLLELVRGARIDDDIDEEIAFHVEHLEAEFVARGMPPPTARAAAMRQFGDARHYHEISRREKKLMVKARRRSERLRGWGWEIRMAARSLVRSPAFTLAAATTLALAIGANTAIFSVFNAVLLRPLDVPELERLVVIREDLPGLGLFEVDLAPAEVMDLVERDDLFSAVTGYRAGSRTLTGHGAPMRVEAATTLGDFAGVFAVRPHIGRFFAPEQAVAGPREVAVVSFGIWQQLAGGDPGFLGSLIELDGVPFEVVGVLPPDFRHPRSVQIWVPFAYTENWHQNRGSLFLRTVARLGPDLNSAQLDAGIEAEAARWNQEYHAGSQFGKELSTIGFIEHGAGPLRSILFVLMGAVVFVLLIAAANVSSLQLVRGVARQREIAVRTALGGGRIQIARLLLFENVLLGLAGGAAGLLVGVALVRLLTRWAPAEQMHLTELPLDAPVLGFTALLSLGAVVLFGLIPAIRTMRVDPQRVLSDSGRGTSGSGARSRVLQASVVVQIALALVLLLGSGLMLRTLSNLVSAEVGFDPRGLVTAQVSLPGSAYSTERRTRFFDELLERIRASPGLANSALVFGLPFAEQTDSSPIDIPGRPREDGDPERHAEARIVSPGYFRTMGTTIIRGRDFDGTEREGEGRKAIVDQTFAETFFPDEDAVGQIITGYVGEETEIIGVVARVDREEIGSEPKAVAYYPRAQLPWISSFTVVTRTGLSTGAAVAQLRSAVAEIDPNVPLHQVRTMSERIDASLAPRRLAMLALGAFGVLSVLLAALGVYGVMRYTTNQRTREIGIRMAVGADPPAVAAMVLRRGLVLTGAGIVAGTVTALATSRLLTGILFGVEPTDPWAFGSAVGVLAAVSAVACWLPARAATRVDPVTAMRSE